MTPTTTQRGFAGAGRDAVRPVVLRAWSAFLGAAQASDLDRPTRLPGWRAQEVCTHLGVWDDYDALAGLIASARDGGSGPAPDVDAANARVTSAHRHASRAEVLDALRRHRDGVRAYLDTAPPELDDAPTAGPVGVLPLLTIVLAEAYELAVHALDLRDCGAGDPPGTLLDAGLLALAEVTGALAAAHDVSGAAALVTPAGGWRFEAAGGGWTVERVDREGVSSGPRGAARGPVVRGEAAALLEASAGRANPVALLARRRLSLHDAAGLLRLAPLVEVAPNLPGGPLLSVAARTLSGAGGLLARWGR
jgi:uncharacterized protein (TIGR03083 family)